MIPAWSDGILACLDPGAGFFLIILTSATLSYTLGLVWNDQMSWADQNEKCCQRGSNDSQSYTVICTPNLQQNTNIWFSVSTYK